MSWNNWLSKRGSFTSESIAHHRWQAHDEPDIPCFGSYELFGYIFRNPLSSDLYQRLSQ